MATEVEVVYEGSLMTALGSCALTLMGMAATKLKIDLKGARAMVKKEMTLSPPRRIQRITLEFFIPVDYPEEIRQALIKAAKSCPVHESLHPDISQEFTFHFGALL
jgi:putative redox protein